MKKYLFSFSMIVGLIAILTVSCNQEALDITPNTYSGEEYFKSIFLLQGELTKQIPSLRHFAKHIVAESEESMAAIINQINEADTSFFSDLKAAIASKNANQVEMVMDRGGALIEVLTLQNATLDSKVEEQLAKVNSNDYDFTNEADVKKFVNTVNRIVDSNSKYSDRPIEEMGAEKCITSIHIIVICYVVIYVDVKILFKSPEGDRIAAPANDDLFLKEKLVSEVLSLN